MLELTPSRDTPTNTVLYAADGRVMYAIRTPGRSRWARRSTTICRVASTANSQARPRDGDADTDAVLRHLSSYASSSSDSSASVCDALEFVLRIWYVPLVPELDARFTVAEIVLYGVSVRGRLWG